MVNEAQQILKILDDIKLELDYIKKHITDIDTVLTEDDIESIEEAEKEFKEGKTTSLEDLKKELGMLNVFH